jgi:hypothetical protein
MSQESKPRFSHITVGQAKTGESPQPEQEEVTVIEAASVVPIASAASTVPGPTREVGAEEDAEATDELRPERQASSADPRDGDEWPGGPGLGRDIEESDLDVTMPRAQKLVLVACFIGLVVAIVLLVLSWVFQR